MKISTNFNMLMIHIYKSTIHAQKLCLLLLSIEKIFLTMTYTFTLKSLNKKFIPLEPNKNLNNTKRKKNVA